MSATTSKKPLTLYCFSPPVMLATLLIEVSFAFYVVWRYHMTTITRLVVMILVCLSVFQGTEYMLCGGMGVDGGTWSRLGYAAITALPPLGLHLAYKLAGKKASWLVASSYVSGLAFVIYFVGIANAISGETCYANYVVFDTEVIASSLYGVYYYGWLITGAYMAWVWSRVLSKGRKKALFSLSLGYLAFLLPTTTVNIIDPATIAGIPSIMCGFAVILAFILVGRVAPESIKVKRAAKVPRLRFPV